MATALCLMASDRKQPMPLAQVLIYPVTDTRTDSPSYRQNAMAKPLDKAGMEWFLKQYAVKPGDLENKYLAPMRASTAELAVLPPATIITAAIDPLRSDGATYAERLRAAGVDVTYRNYDGVTHEFFGMADVVDEAKAAQGVVIERLKEAFTMKAKSVAMSRE